MVTIYASALPQEPTLRAGVRLALVLSAGLLTKAYFLALLPVVFVVCLLARKWKYLLLIALIVLLLAGPWYGRNLALYGVISGMQEARSGIESAALVAAIPALQWPTVVLRSARWALWTGNNSFVSFSRNTINLVLVLLGVALLLWAAAGYHHAAEWITAAHCAVFIGALGYVTVLSFLFTKGSAGGLSPWYSQVILAPVLGLALLGCSRAGLPGRIVATALVMLFGYLLIATYVVKLIPLYGGFMGRTSLAALAVLYSSEPFTLIRNLDSLTLMPAYVIALLTCIVSVLTAGEVVLLARSLNRSC